MPLGTLPFNPFPRSTANRVVGEAKVISTSQIFTPNEGPFHAGTLEVSHLVSSTLTTLTYGVDYENAFYWNDASMKLGSKVFGAVLLSAGRRSMGGTIYISYNAIGGSIMSGLNFSGLLTKTAVQAKTQTLEAQMTMPVFPTIANIWQDTSFTDLAQAKASLAGLGLDLTVTARSS